MPDFTEKRADDPRITDHEARIGVNERKIAVVEKDVSNMASKIQVVELAGEIKNLGILFENRFSQLTEKLGYLADTAKQQTQINNEAMRADAKRAEESHKKDIEERDAAIVKLRAEAEEKKLGNLIKYWGSVIGALSLGAGALWLWFQWLVAHAK